MSQSSDLNLTVLITKERQTGRHTQRQRDRDRETETDRERNSQRQKTDRQTETEIDTERQRHRETVFLAEQSSTRKWSESIQHIRSVRALIVLHMVLQ